MSQTTSSEVERWAEAIGILRRPAQHSPQEAIDALAALNRLLGAVEAGRLAWAEASALVEAVAQLPAAGHPFPAALDRLVKWARQQRQRHTPVKQEAGDE
jgi:hypothetical protein